jgi:phage terminase large subunit-like protein
MKQTYGAFTGCVETLEMMVKLKACSFSDNPIIPWCFSNCVIDEDRIGNRKPIKAQQTLKIDGSICCLMCQEQFNSYKR